MASNSLTYTQSFTHRIRKGSRLPPVQIDKHALAPNFSLYTTTLLLARIQFWLNLYFFYIQYIKYNHVIQLRSIEEVQIKRNHGNDSCDLTNNWMNPSHAIVEFTNNLHTQQRAWNFITCNNFFPNVAI